MSSLPRHHLRRPRLTDALQKAQIGVIVGGGGCGKSTLAAEFSDVLGVPTITAVLDRTKVTADLLLVRLRSAAARLGLSDVAAQMDQTGLDPSSRLDAMLQSLRQQPVLIVIDEIHNAEPDAAELLTRIAEGLGDDQKLLLIGRHLPAALEAVREAEDTAAVTTNDLALSAEELDALCARGFGLELTEARQAELRAATDGWLAAVVMFAARTGTDPTDVGMPPGLERSGPAALAALVDDILRRLPRREQAGLVQAAHLPLLDDTLVAAATRVDDLLVKARAAGLPLSDGPGSWCQLIGPVRDLLASRAGAQPATVARGAQEYAARGEVAVAVDLLISSGQADSAAELLARLAPHEADDLDVAELVNVTERLPETAVAKFPRLLLHLARACEPGALTRLRASTLARARALTEPTDDPVLLREIEAERARDLVWVEQHAEAERLAGEVLGATGIAEELTRARLLEVLGWVAAFQKDDVHLGYAEERLEIAARAYRAHEQWSWLAHLMLPLAVWVHAARGAYDEALRCLDEGLALEPHQHRWRGVILTFRAELLASVGRYDESADNLAEAQAIAETVHDARLKAFIEWDRAREASQLGDEKATVAAIEAAESNASEWFDQSGCMFLAEAADFLDRVGLTDAARDYLARAHAQQTHDEPALARAGAALLARSGDPIEAERSLQAMLAAPWFEPRLAWHVTLMRARAAARRGDSDSARLTAEAFAQAAKLGYPQLPLVQERAIAEELLALAASSGRMDSLNLEIATFPVVISMLGRFEVTQGGRRLDVPAGQGRQLLKVIASAGGNTLADQAIEQLWPEVDPDVGANRLRTVLNRLRESVGELVTREEGSLRLGAHVHTDAHRFEQAARRAETLATSRTREALSIARSALAIYRGDLLPDDAYEPWSTMPRERLRRHALSLLDICADDAARVGDLDEAVRCLVRATDLAPYEEERYLTAARHLLAQGRRGAARSYVDRARAVLDELSLSPPAALIELDRLVRRM